LLVRPPDDPSWVHEIKFDGYRIQARLDRGEVRLLTRKGLDWTSKFGNVAEAVAALSAETALIDGEIVGFEALVRWQGWCNQDGSIGRLRPIAFAPGNPSPRLASAHALRGKYGLRIPVS
jgi:hypothetical protein